MPWLASSRASIVEAPVFVLVFLWLSAALGRKIQRWLGVPQAGADAERALTALALGAGALQVLPFALGAMGQLGVSSARLAMLVSAIVLFPEMRRVLAEAARAIGRRRRPTWTLAWTLALLPGLITAALWALAPTTDTDGLWYHLTVPKRWLASGSLGYLPTYPNSNMPMGVEMLFTLALSAVGDSGAKLLHFALGVCGAIGLYLTGARLRTPTAGAAAVALYLFGPLGVAELLGWAFLEGATTFATIGATLAWVTWYREREQGWLRCAFLLAGIGLSFKMTTGLLPLALAGLTGVVEVDRARARSLRTATARLWGPLALCLAPVAPWLGRAAIVTGNPFFPLLAGHIPSRDFSPTLATEWAYFNRYLNWAIIIGRDWTIERRQTILLGCGFVIMVVAGVACAVLRSWLARAVTLILLVTVLAQLGTVGLYLRYWIPMAAVLSLPILVPCEKAISGRWQRAALVAGAAMLSLVQARRAVRSAEGDFAGLARTALGIADRRAFLLRHMPPFPLYEEVNRSLPNGARILMSFYCGGFYIDRTTYCTDIVQGSIRMTTWEAFLADVRGLGITHVLAPRVEASPGPVRVADAAGVGFMVQGEEHAFIGRLLADHGQLLAAAGDDGLYVLKDLPATAPRR